MAIEQWLVDGQKTIDIERIRRIKANLVGGSISILAHDEPQARVEVTATSVRNLKVAVDGDTLVIDHPQLTMGDIGESAKTLWGRPQAEVSVLVPVECDVDVNAASAEVLVVGLAGNVSLNTASGEQFIDGTTGSLSLRTVDAEISVRGHGGSVKTKTVAGDVTVSGEIERFSGNTVTGATVLDVTSGQPDRIANRSVSGATTIRIPADVTPSYSVSTLTARASLEGEPTQPVAGQTYVSPEREYEKRRTEVHLRTIAGRITVVRASESDGPAPDAYGSDAQAGSAGPLVTTRKVFRRIVKENFDERIDERVDRASDQLGVEPTPQDADGTAAPGGTDGARDADPESGPRAAAPQGGQRAAENQGDQRDAADSQDGPRAAENQDGQRGDAADSQGANHDAQTPGDTEIPGADAPDATDSRDAGSHGGDDFEGGARS